MIVLIPSYEPDERLVRLVTDLLAAPGLEVVVVDDGSGPAYAGHFAAVAALGAELLTHEANRGKGAALKTGFAHIARTHPGTDVVCADSDGQHTPVDVLRVAAALSPEVDVVLGVRRFTGRVPLRSRLGNDLTRRLFAAVTGTGVVDTQTGLRAYPARRLEWLTGVPGERFEYELELLLAAAREGQRIEQVDIATIYLDANASSHFRPLADSARIYARLLAFLAPSALAFTASSFAAFVVDTALLLGLWRLTGALVPAVVAARLVSATGNYLVNRRLVFGRTGEGGPAPHRVALPRYAALAVALLAGNVLLMETFVALTGSVLLAKVVTESSLYAVSFLAQRTKVFARRRPSPAPVSVPTCASTSTCSTTSSPLA